MHQLRLVISVMAIFALTACNAGWDLDNLRRAPMKGSAYQTALAKKYRAYSEAEAKNFDWWSSQYFAKKGLSVAYGRNVQPENPDNWDVPSSMRPALGDGRAKLMAVLTPEAINEHPEVASSAVMQYDCWVENMKDGWQGEEIDSCRSRFFDELATLEELMKESTAKTLEYTIYFATNHAELDNGGRKVVMQIIKDLSLDSGDYDVVVNGHTDRVGSPQYNMKLGLRRANSVKAALVEGGVLAGKIAVYSFGETDPTTATADGIGEPKNRRVEIFISE